MSEYSILGTLPEEGQGLDEIIESTNMVLNKAVAWAKENSKHLATSVDDTQIGERLVHLYVNTCMQLIE